jgi:hypothetical protein
MVLKVGGEALGKVSEAMGKFRGDVSDYEGILFLTAREESTKGHFKIRGLKFLDLSQTMFIGGKDMYRGGIDIYDWVY